PRSAGFRRTWSADSSYFELATKALKPRRFQGFFCFVSRSKPLCRHNRARFIFQNGVLRSRKDLPMVVVMQSGASQQQIDHVVERIEQLGLRSHIIVGTERTVIAALGEKRDGAKQALETGEGVDKVVPILAPYKMASTEVKQERTVVTALGLKVGNNHLGMIAGPCSVESREQILEI